MRTVGVAATAAAVGTSTVGGAFGAENTVDLGAEGLSDGDNIDSYIEEFFTDGNEVHIPAGEYDYTGAGLSGDKANCALIGSPDGVVFNRPDPEVTVRPSIMATDGTVRFENITIRGQRGEEQSRWRVGAESGATMEIFNVNIPDGTVEGSDSTGFYAGTDHGGTLHCKACYFEGLGNVAMYVSDAYTGEDGRVVVEDCVFRNSNSSMVRFAPSDSVIRGCYFEGTEEPPEDHTGGTTLRGIKVDDAGTGALIEDSEFYWTRGANPIRLHYRGEGGTGNIRNVRIYNDGDSDAIQQDWDTAGSWTGENIHLTGSGNPSVPSHFGTVTGSEAAEPNTEYEIWTPVGSESTESADDTTEGTTNASQELTAIPLGDGPTLLPREADVGGGAALESEHDGYSGDGFVNFPNDNGYVEWPISSDGASEYELTIRYALGDSERTGQLVAGDSAQSVTVTGTGAWTNWDTQTETVTVPDGVSTLRIEATGEDFGNVDSVAVTRTGSEDDGVMNRLEIDGTGDAQESAYYRFEVSGDLEFDAERTVAGDGETRWSTGTISGGRVTGHVRNGVDAFYYTGTLQTVEVDGEADINVFFG